MYSVQLCMFSPVSIATLMFINMTIAQQILHMHYGSLCHRFHVENVCLGYGAMSIFFVVKARVCLKVKLYGQFLPR